jgi:hypothetical protein
MEWFFAIGVAGALGIYMAGKGPDPPCEEPICPPLAGAASALGAVLFKVLYPYNPEFGTLEFFGAVLTGVALAGLVIYFFRTSKK